MISKYLYISIIIRVLLIVVLSSLLGYFIFVDSSIRISIVLISSIILLTINLIYFLNSTNRKIRFFFESVRNDDSSLSFPIESKSVTLRELYISMNRVNQEIQKLKIENRLQEQFFQILLEHIAVGIITYDDKGISGMPIRLSGNCFQLRSLPTCVRLNVSTKNFMRQ